MEPTPASALARFSNFGLARRSFGQDKEGHIVLTLKGEDVVRVRSRADMLNLQACLFADLAARTHLDRLAELEMAAGRCPTAGAVRAAPLAEQHSAVSDDEDTDADLRLGSGHRVELGGAA
jgi:hypothetical protein